MAVLPVLDQPAGDRIEPPAQFVRVRRDRVAEVLETLLSLGQARQVEHGLYAP